MRRAEKAKLGMLEIELRKQAYDAAETDDLGKGQVSVEQISSAAKVEVVSKDIGLKPLKDQIDRLCIEYEIVRETLPSGDKRTKAMNRIMAQMRVIGPSVSVLLDDLKNSQSAGERLAAIAIMQMEPKRADLKWLELRFGNESPFIFYQVALLLQTLSQARPDLKLSVIDVAERACDIVKGFSGIPDLSTLDVLKSIIAEVH
jgi:hypothetical protein